MVFLLILLTMPILEIFTFIATIEEIGFLNAFFLCILTAVIGVALVQKQGLDTLTRGQRALNDGLFPAQELFDGLCLFVAGACLIVPGFITDTIGFLLLVPPVRKIVQDYVLRHMDVKIHAASASYGRGPAGDVVEGTFERVDEPAPGGDETPRIDRRP